MIIIYMLKHRINSLEKQHGGAIPFSAVKKRSKRTPRKSLKKHKKNKKKSVSPSRVRRRATKKTTRSKKKTIRDKKIKKCSCGAKTFTGKEKSPRGLGKCEECYPLNVVLRGADDQLYENRKNSDGDKIWFKLT